VINELPDPVMTQIYRLKAVVGPVQEIVDGLAGRRRVVPLAGGTFTGPELNGNLVPGGSATWQLVSPDGSVVTEVRYTLQTDRGALLYVESSGIGQANDARSAPAGPARDIDQGEPLLHVTTRIETASPELSWLNKAVYVTVAQRTTVSWLYETYLVG